MLVNKRWKTAVRVCSTYQGADTSSDHSLVMCKLKLRLKRTPRQRRQEPRRNIELLNNTSVRKAFSDQVNEGLMLPAKSEKLDSKVWRLNEAIQKAVKEVLPLACMDQVINITVGKRKEKNETKKTGIN